MTAMPDELDALKNDTAAAIAKAPDLAALDDVRVAAWAKKATSRK